MRHYLPYFLLVGLSLLAANTFGQISIDYPTDRAIFQRNQDNSATIHVSGTFTREVDKIEAKLTPINGGEQVGWAPIQDKPTGGFYSGNISARGGWYVLEVRGIKDGQVVGDPQTIQHVGVGEVFLVAGQSNGQGYNGLGAQGASDDRVSTVRYNNTEVPNLYNDLPYPSFEHLDANSDISPRGYSAWCWGRLGDQIANRLGVPVLFYNVAWYGTAVRAWRQSINGTGYSIYTGEPIVPNGMPYANMRAVIQRYAPITGLRGVLWIQGEADNFANTSTDSYADDLRAVIEASRIDAGQDLSWMISITSYDNGNGRDTKVNDGQFKVINTVPNTFAGPITDLIQIPRNNDNVHFTDQGLTQLGDAWSQELNENFFSRSTPISGISPLRVTASCAGNGNVNLTASGDNLQQFSWSNGGNSQTVQVGNGSYRVWARNSRGNYVFSPEIRVYEAIQPQQPTITLEGSNPVCIGNSATLVSNISGNVRWNTGSTSDRLAVTTGGDYFVTIQNVYGCESTSNTISVKVLNAPLPDKPKISASDVLTFCDGGEVTLTSDSKWTNIWSTGADSKSIIVKNSGSFRVRALDTQGCYSPESDAIDVKVNPLPARPVIALSGNTTFCQGENVSMTSNYQTGNIWSTSATSQSISVNTSGNFSLKQRDANGCESTSDVVTVKVNPLPAQPAITALRPTTFCLRDYTTLRASEGYTYLWSNGAESRDIEVRNSGNFTISTKDENGCVSPVSAVVQVVANPLPATPTIAADGPTTFCADLSVNLRSTMAAGFLWSNGASTQTLKVTQAGTYSVQAINEFQCYSDPSNSITTTTLALPPAPIVQALAATTFCDGDTISLRASNGEKFFWSNALEGPTIEVFKTGTYAARVLDEQGCYSPYSREISVEAKPSPTIPVIRQIGTFTLLAENNLSTGSHVWKYNNVALADTGVTLKAVRSGSYVVNNTIVYSPTLTCYSDFSEPFSFILDTSTPGFVAYPNPTATGKVTIETIQNLNNAEVQIYDSRGVLHKTFKVNRFDSQRSFNLAGLTSGIYIVKIVSLTFSATQKLVIVQ